MELTKAKRKILDDASKGHLKMASKPCWLHPIVVIGIIGAVMIMVEGLKMLASGKEGYWQIAFALVIAAFMLAFYENLRFRGVSFSPIWKLKNERDNPQLTTKQGDLILDRQESNDSMHSSGEQRRTLGPGYLDSPLQRRNWVLLMLVVIFVGGAVVPNKLMKPLGAVLNIAELLVGTCLVIAAFLLELDCIRPSWRWGRSALASFLLGLGLLGMGLVSFYRESLLLHAMLLPFLLVFAGMLLEGRKTNVL
jgi:hypothetical protein